MGKYQFYQDRKVSSWERDYFTVEAESYEDAEAAGYHVTVQRIEHGSRNSRFRFFLFSEQS